MLSGLADSEFRNQRATPLAKLCAAGADYGWREFQRKVKADLLADLSAKAKAGLKRDLQRRLERVTRPCLELEWTSFGLAMDSIGLGSSSDRASMERMFLRDKPSHRLFSLFKKFPVLARLWSQLIRQWRNHTTEVLQRFASDRAALSRLLFGNRPLGSIVDVRFGLSDAHHSGRTVARLRFQAGSIIYKPRPGSGEWEWFSLLEWINDNGFAPRLRAARVLRRKNYFWMEDVEAASCNDEAAVRRFYERLGGIIAAAYLLKAVDCHRENLIAAGECPVLVDVDALWHVSPLTKTQSAGDILLRTGFFPNTKRRSLQSRSSVLGQATAGNHLARIAGKPVKAASYTAEIIRGFTRACSSVLGTPNRRAAFLRRLRRIRSQERRWIYWATERYAALRDMSRQPGLLRSSREREAYIGQLCRRDTVSASVTNAEVRALKQLDIPYFQRVTNEALPADKLPIAGELIEAIQGALTPWR